MGSILIQITTEREEENYPLSYQLNGLSTGFLDVTHPLLSAWCWGFFKLASSPIPFHPLVSFCGFGDENWSALSWLPVWGWRGVGGGLLCGLSCFCQSSQLISDLSLSVTKLHPRCSLPLPTMCQLQGLHTCPPICLERSVPSAFAKYSSSHRFRLKCYFWERFSSDRPPFQLDATFVVLITPWTSPHSTEHNL